MRASLRAGLGIVGAAVMLFTGTVGLHHWGKLLGRWIFDEDLSFDPNHGPAAWALGVGSILLFFVAKYIWRAASEWNWPENLLKWIERWPVFTRIKATPLSDLVKRTQRDPNRVSKFVR